MTYPQRLSGVVGLDLETFDPGLRNFGPGWARPGDPGRVVGVALAWDGGADYWEWTEATRRWLRDELANPGLVVVCHNAHYDTGWLRRSDVAVRGRVMDTMFLAALLDEYQSSYSLDYTARRYLGRGKNEEGLIAWAKEHKLDPKKDLWKAPFDVQREYAIPDAVLTRDLFFAMLPLINQQNLTNVVNLEHDLIPVVQEMRWRGILIDVDKVERTSKDLARRMTELQSALNTSLGRAVNVNSPKDLALMCSTWGLTPPTTAKGNLSFTKTWIQSVNHPGLNQVRAIRRLATVKSTFVDGLLHHVGSDGRVHGELHQLPSDAGGTVTGRFSSSRPNLQNQPAKDPELGPLVRGLWLPEPGQQWAACDYSQQEPRLMVHYAEAAGVAGAHKAGEAYRSNPDTDFHQFVADLTGLPRSKAKIINLGLAYGMGGAKLCLDLGLPVAEVTRTLANGKVQTYLVAGPEGQELLDQYHHHAPFVRGLTDACSRRVKRRRWIKTLGGRLCRFGVEGDPNTRTWAYPYQAMNRLIQGSAADQTKMAMLELWRQGIVPLIQVHDELGVSVETPDDAKRVQHIMEHCVELRVPSKVDVDLGPNWGEAA